MSVRLPGRRDRSRSDQDAIPGPEAPSSAVELPSEGASSGRDGQAGVQPGGPLGRSPESVPAPPAEADAGAAPQVPPSQRKPRRGRTRPDVPQSDALVPAELPEPLTQPESADMGSSSRPLRSKRRQTGPPPVVVGEPAVAGQPAATTQPAALNPAAQELDEIPRALLTAAGPLPELLGRVPLAVRARTRTKGRGRSAATVAAALLLGAAVGATTTTFLTSPPAPTSAPLLPLATPFTGDTTGNTPIDPLAAYLTPVRCDTGPDLISDASTIDVPTAVTMVGTTGDLVAGDCAMRASDADTTFALADVGGGAQVLLGPQGREGSVTLLPPHGLQLHTGVYQGAMRAQFSGPHPGLEITRRGRGCDYLSGTFTVTEIARDKTGHIVSLAATFTQHCRGSSAELTGMVRYHLS